MNDKFEYYLKCLPIQLTVKHFPQTGRQRGALPQVPHDPLHRAGHSKTGTAFYPIVLKQFEYDAKVRVTYIMIHKVKVT